MNNETIQQWLFYTLTVEEELLQLMIINQNVIVYPPPQLSPLNQARTHSS